VLRLPSEELQNKKSALRSLVENLAVTQQKFLQQKQSDIDNLVRLFRMASPEKVLQRGFAIVESKGKIVSDAAAISIGDELTIILSGTAIDSTVHHKKPYHGKQFDL
jgi:exodeoxyribonuclease VII large subunit